MNRNIRMLPRIVAAALALSLACAVTAAAAERGLWMRYPAISPDGRSIAFSYRGNLWKVAATGGIAMPLTLGASHNTGPVWSPDGSRIAFASDRNGNMDVFVMPVSVQRPVTTTCAPVRSASTTGQAPK